MSYAIVAVLLIAADQFMKYWAVTHVELNTGIHELIPGILHMTYIKNFGAAFGLFSDKPMLRWVLLALLIAFTVFIVLGLIFRYLRTGFSRWTGLLLLVGLLGNGIDRALFGYVVDMLEFDFISFAIFNLADVLVVVFGILFCISLLTGGIGRPDEEEERERAARRRRDEDEDDEDEDERPARRRREEDERPARRPRPEAQPQRARSSSGKSSGKGSGKPRPAQRPQQAARPKQPRPAEAAPAAAKAVSAEPAPAVPVSAPVEPAASAPAPVKAEAPAPAPKPAPAPAPAAKPVAPVSSGDEFDLDSILAEFK